MRTGKPNRAGGVGGHSMAAIAVRDARNFGSCGKSAANVYCLAMALPNFAMNIVNDSVPSK